MRNPFWPEPDHRTTQGDISRNTWFDLSVPNPYLSVADPIERATNGPSAFDSVLDRRAAQGPTQAPSVPARRAANAPATNALGFRQDRST